MPTARCNRGLVVLIGILATSCFAGCGGGDEGDGKILHVPHENYTVLVDEDHTGDSVAGVRYSGMVTMAGDCISIGGATVIWPYGTTIISDSPLTLDVPSLGPVHLGDWVTGRASDYSAHLPKGIDSIPLCPIEQVLAVYPGSVRSVSPRSAHRQERALGRG